MKKILILVAATFVSSFSFAQSKDADEIKKLNAEWIASYVTRDTATMSKIFADDIILTNPSGKTFHKKDMLKGTMAQEFVSTKVDTASVRLFGNIGIINAEITGVLKTANGTTTVRTDYMDVYEKRKGRWYCVAAHVTLLSGN
jgi:uncharacterized protein (TIGR02246 family)